MRYVFDTRKEWCFVGSKYDREDRSRQLVLIAIWLLDRLECKLTELPLETLLF